MLSDGSCVREGKWTADEVTFLNQYSFLTAKPVVYLVNLSQKDYIRKKNKWWVVRRVAVRPPCCCAASLLQIQHCAPARNVAPKWHAPIRGASALSPALLGG